jgi:hypothetical protein
VGEDAGQELPEPGELAARARHPIEDEGERDQADRDADHAPRRLEQDDDRHDAGDDVGRLEEAGAGDDRVEVEEEVAPAVERAAEEGPIDEPAERAALPAPDRERQEGDQQDDQQVEPALVEEVERRKPAV